MINNEQVVIFNEVLSLLLSHGQIPKDKGGGFR